MDDNRRSGRKKTFLTAYAVVGGSQGALPCLVRDLSQSGARIMMAGAERLPARFELHINGRAHMLRVDTVWRTATQAGVRLLEKVPAPAPQTVEARRVGA